MMTNEGAKWGQVNEWHENESKHYRQVVNAGIAPPVDQKAAWGPSSVVTEDRDIGCKGGTGTDLGEETGKSSPLMDLGSMPKNVYTNGLVEDWKELIFLWSLQKNARERWKQSL
jgi:hypothetical protein